MNKDLKKQHKLSSAVRIAVMGAILAVSTILGIMHQYAGKKPVGVDALCPFGAVESLWIFISEGGFLKRVALSSFILMGAVLLVTIVFRRSFCGNYCPLGFLQELFDRLGKKIFKKRLTVPQTIDKYLRYLKYLVLAAVTVLSFMLADLVIRPYDPWAAYHHLWSNELFEEFLIGFLVLLAALVGSLLYNRFFCKYLCPMGALLGILSKFGLFAVTRNEKTCINCSACTKACPVNIDVQHEKRITTAECINCNRCVDSCPVEDTLYSEYKGKKLSALPITIATLAIMLSVIAISSATGSFQWQVQALETADHGAEFDIEEIRGRHTFKELSDATGISKEAFMQKFSITEDQFNGPIKDVTHAETATFDTDDVRFFIAKELGIEYGGE